MEESIRTIVATEPRTVSPMRYLILDLTLVAGVDMSAAESFVRLQRLLLAKDIVMVLCGFPPAGDIDKPLKSVGVIGTEGVEVLENFEDAIKCKTCWLFVSAHISTLVCFNRDRKRIPKNLVQTNQD